MTTRLRSDLASALSELAGALHHDREALHRAVAVVFSSMFQAAGLRFVIVGGQASSHWLQVNTSLDVDFVVDDFRTAREHLESIGFEREELTFRFLHRASDVLIELFDRPVTVANVTLADEALVTVQPDDIGEEAVRRLMPGCALMISPTHAFLNCAEAAMPASGWFDTSDGGSEARDRAAALLALYEGHIVGELSRWAAEGLVEAGLRRWLFEEFGLELGGC